MRDRKLDRLFDRFRKRGDTAALARVFDATAPDLLGLAVHLVRDVGEGEDLVQQTFLTAIEKADRYDADRRLMPWLVGILVRHASNARRKLERTRTDPELDPTDRLGAPGDADESEFTASVTQALSGLSATYRAVLEPYLLRGERAVDIARASRTSPGTVRVQIRRGLDELRRALPAGLALGTGVLLGGRSLADVRGRVLEQAARAVRESAPLGAASVSSTTLLGGLAVLNKLALGTLVLTIVSLLGWLATGGLESDMKELGESPSGQEATQFSGQLQDRLPLAKGTAGARPESGAQRVEVAAEQGGTNELDLAMSGASGRIMDELGKPVVGIRVQLLELRTNMFEFDLEASFDSDLGNKLRGLNWNPRVGEALTDELGRFEFWGADPHASHGLAIDHGGARPSLRIVDITLRSGEVVEIGDIQLMATRTVVGMVVDFEGRPVAGARVRAALLPPGSEFFAGVGPDSWLLFRRGQDDDGVALKVPEFLSDLLAQFPVPTTRTDAQGHFALSGVPQTPLSVYVDHEAQATMSQALDAEETDVKTLSFPARQRFSGHIVDASGQAVAGAQVLFGHVKTPRGRGSEEAIAQGEVRSAADGGFHFDCLGSPSIFARRDPSSAWSVRADYTSGEDIVIPTTITAQVQLMDRDGLGISGARFHFVTGSQDLLRKEMFLGASATHGVVKELGDGRYDVSGLLPGPSNVRVMAAGFALLNQGVELAQGNPGLELQLDRAGSRRVQVVDGQTGKPITNATASVAIEGTRQGPLSRGTTGIDGIAELSGVPIEGEHHLALRVNHPGYAPQVQALGSAGSEIVQVKLGSSNQALFRVVADGRTPTYPLSISITPGRANAQRTSYAFPLIQVSDVRGHAVFENLAVGEWTYELQPRLWNLDVMMLLASGGNGEVYAKGEFTIREGQRTTVDVDLSPELLPDFVAAETSGVEGTIKIQSDGVLQLQVALIKANGRQLEREWQDLPPTGRYRFDGLAAGEYALFVGHVSPNQPMPLVLAAPQFTARPNQVVRQDVALTGTSVTVALVDEEGNPVEDAGLLAFPMMEELKGNAICEALGGGLQRVTVWGPGEYLLRARSPVAGLAAERVTITGVTGERFDLQLSRGLPCAGSVHLAESKYSGTAYLNFAKLDGSGTSGGVDIEFQEGVGHFELLGLSAGEYSATIYPRSGGQYRTRLQLPEGGNSALILAANAPGLEMQSTPASSVKADH